jgi:hypothetical protein
VLRAVANWWDSIELWITQLAFPFQVVLAIVVLLPLCSGVAVLADMASDAVDDVLARQRAARRRVTGGSDRAGRDRAGS